MFAWVYFEGVHDREGRVRIGRRGARAFLAGPTDGDLYMAAIGIDMAEQAEFHCDREAHFAAGIRAWPELADVIGDGRRVGPIRVLTNWHGYFREAAGPGWVLVGDAGHFTDPTPGQGIGDALRQTDRLAPPSRTAPATAVPTRPCGAGGNGATMMLTKCIGLQAIWVYPACRHR